MPGPISVALGGVPLYGKDANGVSWDVQRLDGWDSPDVRLDLQARPNEHGSFDQESWYAERKPTIEGTIVAPSFAAQRQAEQALASLTSALAPVLLQVDEPPYSRQVAAKRAGRLQMTQVGLVTQYVLPLVAPDPRRYDTTESSLTTPLPSNTTSGFGAPFGAPFGAGAAGAGGDVAVTNVGDIASWPVLTLTGPMLNPVVRNNTTGDELRFAIDLTAGNFLTVDTAERTVLLNGTANRRTTLIAGSRWPSVEPGSNTFQLRASTYDPAASLGIRYRSAWS
jgi:hypothetical protein